MATRARGELDPLLHTIGERANEPVAYVGEVERGDDGIGPLPVLARFATRMGKSEDLRTKPGGLAVDQPDRHRIEDGETPEQRQVLEGAGHTEAGEVPRRHAGKAVVADPDRSGIRRVKPADRVDQGGFTGSVRADDRMDLPLPDRQIHGIERHGPTEPERHAFDYKEGSTLLDDPGVEPLAGSGKAHGSWPIDEMRPDSNIHDQRSVSGGEGMHSRQ